MVARCDTRLFKRGEPPPHQVGIYPTSSRGFSNIWKQNKRRFIVKYIFALFEADLTMFLITDEIYEYLMRQLKYG